MSYRAEISFKQISAKDVFAFLKEFKDWVKNSIHEIAEDNFMYCPTVRWLHRSYADLNDHNSRDWCMQWARNLFSYRYIYLPEVELLCVYGVPGIVQDLFDDTIYFQNSTDQNYDYNTWDKIELFKEVARKWQAFTDEGVRERLHLDNDDDLDYHRKSACYNEIWNNYLKQSLYDEDSVVYLQLFGYYDIDVLTKFILTCERIAKLEEK